METCENAADRFDIDGIKIDLAKEFNVKECFGGFYPQQRKIRSIIIPLRLMGAPFIFGENGRAKRL